jgi:hypothetical protein
VVYGKARDLVPIATMARPQLTALDPAIEERFTLESFEVIVTLESAVLRKLSGSTQDKFDLREFIGAVSERLITQSQEDSGRTYSLSCRCITLLLVVTASRAPSSFRP